MLEASAGQRFGDGMPLSEELLPTHLQGVPLNSGEFLTLSGFLVRGSMKGEWSLYPTLDMSRRSEILEADIAGSERLSAEESPFGSLGGTRVFLRPRAEIRVSRGRPAGEDDEFDLDIRLQAGIRQPHDICEGTEDGTTCAAECENETEGCGTDACTDGCTGQGCHLPTDNTCKTDCGATCDAKTCVTCNKATCHTCNTHCNQHTCATCNQATCATCNQATCHTCNTQCNQGTCHTCNQATCHTCNTQCNQKTCVCETKVACTHVTCGHQPGCIV